jgi:hypothetical protein
LMRERLRLHGGVIFRNRGALRHNLQLSTAFIPQL